MRDLGIFDARSNQEPVCVNCEKTKDEHQESRFYAGRFWCYPNDHSPDVFTPNPTPAPKVEQCEYIDGSSDYGKKLTIPEVERHLLNIKSEQCEYCGPICYKGAAHNARVEDNAKWTDDKVELPPLDEECASPFKFNESVSDYFRKYVDCRERQLEAEIASKRKAEKELRVTRRALGLAARDLDTINRSHGMMPIVPEMYLEAARKEQDAK
jgi:hypothetical protein